MKTKKLLCSVLALAMIFAMASLFPAGANADSYGDFDYIIIKGGMPYENTAAIRGYAGNDTEIVIPEEIYGHPVSTIDERAFANNGTVAKVTLPDTVKQICDNAFISCVNLKEINLPNGLEYIGANAFRECALEQVSIPESVTAIGGGAFNRCSSITEITVPATVTVLEDNLFTNCRSLKNIYLPGTLIRISYGAFGNCRSLENVYFDGEDESWYHITIEEYNEPLYRADVHLKGEGEKTPVISGKLVTNAIVEKSHIILWDDTADRSVGASYVVNGKYSFCDILPGTYRLEYCSKYSISPEYIVVVTDENEPVVQDIKVSFYGDASGDGEIAMEDVMFLRMYISGAVDESEIDLFGACFGKGTNPSMKHVIQIRKMFVGY